MFIQINHLVRHTSYYTEYFTTEEMLINSSSIDYIIQDSIKGYDKDVVKIKLRDCPEYIYATDSYDMLCLLMNASTNLMIKEAQEDNDWK